LNLDAGDRIRQTRIVAGYRCRSNLPCRGGSAHARAACGRRAAGWARRRRTAA